MRIRICSKCGKHNLETALKQYRKVKQKMKCRNAIILTIPMLLILSMLLMGFEYHQPIINDLGAFGDDESPWPMVGHDAGRTGKSPYIGSQTNEVKWHYDIYSNIVSSPAIGADGTIFFAEAPFGTIYALYPNGTYKWDYKLDGTFMTANYSSPAVGSDGTIYIGSLEIDEGAINDSHFYAINPDGTLKWRYGVDGWINSSPAIGADGTVYFCSEYLYALNQDGTQKWKTQMIVPGCNSSPAIGPDGTVYAAAWTSLFAINPENGNVMWEFETEATTNYSPAVSDDGTIYIGSNDSYLYAIKPDGTLKWRYMANMKFDELFHSSPSIGNDGTIYFGNSEGDFYALNLDGTLKWVITLGSIYDPVHPSPAIGADGTLYVASKNNLHAVSSSGTVKWKRGLLGSVDTSPSIGEDGTVYAGGRGLWAIGEEMITYNHRLYFPVVVR